MTEKEQAIRRIPWTGDSTVPCLLSIIDELRAECAQRKESLTNALEIAGELARYTHGDSGELDFLRARLHREMAKRWAGAHVAEAVTQGIRADMDGNASNFVEAMRYVAATQTVDISGASATMQAGGEPRRGQYLPDAALPSPYGAGQLKNDRHNKEDTKGGNGQ